MQQDNTIIHTEPRETLSVYSEWFTQDLITIGVLGLITFILFIFFTKTRVNLKKITSVPMRTIRGILQRRTKRDKDKVTPKIAPVMGDKDIKIPYKTTPVQVKQGLME